MRKLEPAEKAEKIRLTTCGLDAGAGNANCSDRQGTRVASLRPAEGNKGKEGVEDETAGEIGLCGKIDKPCRYRGDMTITAPFVFNQFTPVE
jgi:hypothetical protein